MPCDQTRYDQTISLYWNEGVPSSCVTRLTTTSQYFDLATGGFSVGSGLVFKGGREVAFFQSDPTAYGHMVGQTEENLNACS